jgi:hypothetical protein
MKRLGCIALAALALVIIASPLPLESLAAQDTSSTPAVDPGAIDALKKMSTYLRLVKAFQVEATTTKDDVNDDGQLIQSQSHVNLLVRMPDGLRVEITNADRDRLYFYDGKTFTLWARRVNYYATIAAPPTVGKLADELEEKYGIDVPLEDLFFWGTSQSKIDQIKSATDVGPADVEDVTCEQYAFRQDGLDWQIWIQQGDYPLPRKLVLTTQTDDARPQYSAVLTWNLAPSFNDAAFDFDPPDGAHKIAIEAESTPPDESK